MNAEKFLLPSDELEGLRTVYEVLLHAKRSYGEKTAYRQLEYNGEERSLSFAELAERVDALRAVLPEAGLAGAHFAILGETSAEWICAYLAVISGVGLCVPLDRELSVESLGRQLRLAEVEVAFVSEKYLQKAFLLLPLCPELKTLILLRGEAGGEVPCELLDMRELTEGGRKLLTIRGSAALPQPDIERGCLIIFTSGTTGANKGVLLSNRNIMASLRGSCRLLRPPASFFSILPVNHAFELHTSILGCLFYGSCVCINDELRYFIKNLRRFRPEGCCMVPMMLDTLASQLRREIRRSGKQELFEETLRRSETLRREGTDRRRELFAELLEAVGGQLRMIICGGAKLNEDSAEFLESIGIEVYNGYGITECSPVVAANSLKRIQPGSVGLPAPGLQLRIAEADENGNGEIQLRGDHVMPGYYHDPEDTALVFTEDGWFRTGDLGHMDEEGFLYLSGRLKNLIILPNGKNICPEELEESLMRKLPYILECVVTEDSRGEGLFAHIYPDREFCASEGLRSTEDIRAFVRRDIDAFNRAEPTYRRIGDFAVRETAFEKNTAQKILRYKI